MQQVMVRVKDPETSLKFYCEVLGFRLVMFRDFPQWGFSVYFVAHGLAGPVPEDEDARWRYCMTTPGCVELTWNHGSEAADGAVYNTGNSDATGSGDAMGPRWPLSGFRSSEIQPSSVRSRAKPCSLTRRSRTSKTASRWSV